MIRSRDIDQKRFSFTKKQSIFLLLHYFVGYMFVYPVIVLSLSRLVYTDLEQTHPKFLTGYILFMILSTLAIVKDPLKRSFNHFKNNLRLNLNKVLKNFGLLMLYNFFIAMVLTYVFKLSDPAENQIQIEQMVQNAMMPMFLSTVIFAPIVEEIIFRGVLYQNLRSKKWFYIPMAISILIFGGMHLIAGFEAGNGIIEFLYLFQYGGMAFFMIRAMENTDTIIGSMGVHFLNNALAFSAIVATLMIII